MNFHRPGIEESCTVREEFVGIVGVEGGLEEGDDLIGVDGALVVLKEGIGSFRVGQS